MFVLQWKHFRHLMAVFLWRYLHFVLSTSKYMCTHIPFRLLLTWVIIAIADNWMWNMLLLTKSTLWNVYASCCQKLLKKLWCYCYNHCVLSSRSSPKSPLNMNISWLQLFWTHGNASQLIQSLPATSLMLWKDSPRTSIMHQLFTVVVCHSLIACSRQCPINL